MKIAINWPPDESFVTSIMYEGIMFIKNESPGGDLAVLKQRLLDHSQEQRKEGQRRARAADSGQGEEAHATTPSEEGSKINLMRVPLIGNDLRGNEDLKKLARSCGVEIKGIASLINLVDRFPIKDLDLYRTVAKGEYRIGSEEFVEKGAGFRCALQIMKPDRYQGFALFEQGLFHKQITVYMDAAALVVFLSGLVSSYVTNVDNDHYFLLFANSMIPSVLSKEGSLSRWMDVKGKFMSDLREDIWRVRNSEELIALSVVMNAAAIKAAKETDEDYVSLRVIRAVNEGRAFKIYNEIPLEILLNAPQYSDMSELERLQSLSKGLMRAASAFLSGRGNMDEGRHAYLALKEMALFMNTGGQAHRYAMLREMYQAERAADESDKGKYSRMAVGSLRDFK